MSDDRREIFERLEALERRLGGGHERHGHRHHRRHDCGHDHGHGHHHHHDDHRHHDRHRHHDEDEGFDEKRVIDTIVGLVTEHVGKVVREQARSRQDGEERRLVDLVVGLISEHVREIVVTELDRRFGPAPDLDDECGDDEPPADEPDPEQR